jgi:lipoprotein-anchoring transpeptidase ErfK/SrfK
VPHAPGLGDIGRCRQAPNWRSFSSQACRYGDSAERAGFIGVSKRSVPHEKLEHHGEQETAMKLRRAALCLVFLLPTSGASFAQGWPPWPEFRMDPPSRFEPAPRREEPRREFNPEANARSRSGDTMQDGGARPVILAKAPPLVPFPHPYPANSIVIDVGGRKLYYVLGDNRAYKYSISVGREGFNWTGTETISRKQAWPDWHPPPEMRERDPSLPEKMTGGIRNPLGAVALYLGKTLYRIHGTNDAKSIGRAASSGCFRMLNASAVHLAALAEIGTSVTVVDALPAPQVVSRAPDTGPQPAASAPAAPASADLPQRAAPDQPAVQSAAPADAASRAQDYRTLREEALRPR